MSQKRAEASLPSHPHSSHGRCCIGHGLKEQDVYDHKSSSHRGSKKVATSWALDVQLDGVRKMKQKRQKPTRRHRHMKVLRTWTRNRLQNRSSPSPGTGEVLPTASTAGSEFTFAQKKCEIRPKEASSDRLGRVTARYKGLVENVEIFSATRESTSGSEYTFTRKAQEIHPKASVDWRTTTRARSVTATGSQKQCPGFQERECEETITSEDGATDPRHAVLLHKTLPNPVR